MPESEPTIFTGEVEVQQQTLTADERQVLLLKAGLRRQSAELRAGLSQLRKPEDSAQGKKFEDELASVQAEIDMAPIEPEEARTLLAASRDRLKAKALASLASAPNLSALIYANLAKLEMAAGEDFDESFKSTQRTINEARSIPRTTPRAFLPEAVTIGIAKRESSGKELPSLEMLAAGGADNPELLGDIALALTEEQRREFLRFLPENQRRQASILMDRELAIVLTSKTITEQEMSEREQVRTRVKQELESSLFAVDDFDRRLVRFLAETLKELSDEDSARLLKEISVKAVTSGDEAQKSEIGIFHTARILKTLFEIDQNSGGNLTMKFLAKKELDPHYFRYFCAKLIHDSYLPQSLDNYLHDDKYLPFLRKLISRNLNQFNTVIETISQISGYDPTENEEEIFEAIQDLGDLTPKIFTRYRSYDASVRKQFARQINQLKSGFFRNKPIQNVLSRTDRDILYEMVYLAYRPVGMDFDRVRRLIEQVDDRTEDMQDYQFPENGYEFTLGGQKAFKLKEGERIDVRFVTYVKSILSGNHRPIGDEDEDEIRKQKTKAVLGLAKTRNKFEPSELALLLEPFSALEQVQTFIAAYPSVNESNVFNFLSGLKEMFGIYYKDNAHTAISALLSDSELDNRLVQLFSNPKRQRELEIQMKDEKIKIDWEQAVLPEGSRHRSELLSAYLGKILKPVRQEIERNLRKFEPSEEGKVVALKGKKFKAYISKNVGSFFAKASAGICTAEDIPLFKRRDHFHINIVENDERVVANIQAYIINLEGRPSLLLRGFNPNSSFVDRIDVGNFCDKALQIAHQFANDNNLAGVYITQDTSWHELSNRDQVSKYLVGRYLKKDNERSFVYSVASSHSISYIYQV